MIACAMKNNHEDSMLIGEFSKRLGTTPRTIRLYEQMGLVGAPRRSAGGVRYYCEVDIKRFKFVLKLKVLGISLEEMQKLAKILSLVDSKSEKSVAMLSEHFEILDIHQKNIKQKIASLESFQVDVEKFRNNVLVNCSGRYGSDAGLKSISRK
jgi:DNA-binding transcriptional MerR regulator